MKQAFLFALTLLVCASCSNSKFKVEGTIDGGANSMLYLEQLSQNDIVTLDSVKISPNGDFSFTSVAPEYPDLYRLRLGGEALIFAIDSIETITISGNSDNFATQFTVTNSPATEHIRQLRASARALQSPSDTLTEVEILEAINNHRHLAKEIVLTNTHSLAAYYAVYQTIGGYYLLSPEKKDELPFWNATATAFDLRYPEYYRSKQLKETTLLAMAHQRKSNNSTEIEFEPEVTGMIDISLPNRAGDIVSLSSLKGKVVLVDFTLFAREESPAHILLLRELYNEYHAKGFEIYQVSLDPNKLFWMEQTLGLPWICVRDANTIQSTYISAYNLYDFPALFLINREGDIVARPSYNELSAAVSKLM